MTIHSTNFGEYSVKTPELVSPRPYAAILGKLGLSATANHLVAQNSQPFEPDFSHALDLQSDELWRDVDNGGRPQDEAYIATYALLRKHNVDALRSGKLYKSPRHFMKFVQAGHDIVASSGSYQRLNPDHDLLPAYCGRFVASAPIRFKTRSLSRVQELEPIFEQYGDPYAEGGRLHSGRPNSSNKYTMSLPGIVPGYQAYDIIRYDPGGRVRPKSSAESTESGYEYFYPSSDATEAYMSAMQRVGVSINERYKQGITDKNEVLKMIAKQYQYGAVSRPFRHINNSLFMDLANAQVKMLGFDGVTHGLLDIAAQRMQQDTFANYFSDRVNKLTE